MSKRNIGLFGGSFDPTTEAHVSVAHQVQQALSLDRVDLLINPQNPDKSWKPASFELRMQMAQAQIETQLDWTDVIRVSDFEKLAQDRGIANETIAILHEYRAEFPDCNPVWILGADSVAGIHRWGGAWDEIFTDFALVVVSRPGDPIPAQTVAGRAFATHKRSKQTFVCEPGTWRHLKIEPHPASSTKVREAVLAGERPPFVCDRSHNLIREHDLYLPNVSSGGWVQTVL